MVYSALHRHIATRDLRPVERRRLRQLEHRVDMDTEIDTVAGDHESLSHVTRVGWCCPAGSVRRRGLPAPE